MGVGVLVTIGEGSVRRLKSEAQREGQFVKGLLSKSRRPLGSKPLRGSELQPASVQRKPNPAISRKSGNRLLRRNEITVTT
jgi:hypothetical protein